MVLVIFSMYKNVERNGFWVGWLTWYVVVGACIVFFVCRCLLLSSSLFELAALIAHRCLRTRRRRVDQNCRRDRLGNLDRVDESVGLFRSLSGRAIVRRRSRAMIQCDLLYLEQKNANIACDMDRNELVGSRAVLAPDNSAERYFALSSLPGINVNKCEMSGIVKVMCEFPNLCCILTFATAPTEEASHSKTV